MDIMDRMQLQSNEFNVLESLIKAYKNLPAIVDDDYPEMRHYYERELRNFFEAANLNSRSVIPINKYQSIPHISAISFERALRWHKQGLDSWSESDWYTALAGEAGECFEAVLKMGDVYIYLDLLARRVGLNLEDCVRDTFNRISEREGFPERL